MSGPMAQPCWGLHTPGSCSTQSRLSRAGNAAPALTAIGCGKDGILAAARGKTAILGWMATTVNNS